VRKALIGIRDHFSIDLANGVHLQAKGSFVDHEYEVKRKGNIVARVSKRWFRARETYGIEIAPRADRGRRARHRRTGAHRGRT
jgi:uncharacterized protein YxjI